MTSEVKATAEAAENLIAGMKWLFTDQALAVARDFGQTDGAHHKAWVIDQMVRALLGTGYDEWVKDFCKGVDGPDTYEWDVGIAP